MEELIEEGLSVKYVHDILSVLYSIIKYTASFFPRSFPQIELNYPKNMKKEMRVLSMAEQRVFVDYLMREMDPCKFGVLLALLTGIRIGELCALRWENISLEDGTVTVRSTVQRIRNLDADARKKQSSLSVPQKANQAPE